MRLFVAIELSESIRTALLEAQRRLREFDSMVRWVGRDQMHLTLKFLGEVHDKQVPKICGHVEEAAALGRPGTFVTGAAECFPPRGRVRVLWVGLGAAADWLIEDQRCVEDALAGAGFARESRPFSPHLTLGRVREDTSSGGLRQRADALEIAPVNQAVDRIVLMQSQLTPRGARYARVGSWRLGSKGDSP